MTYIVILRVFKPSLLLIMVYAGPEIGYYFGGGGGHNAQKLGAALVWPDE